MAGYSTGESGVCNPMPRSKYFSRESEDTVPVIVEHSCALFGVKEPTVVWLDTKHNGWHGTYYPDKKQVSFNEPYLGLIIHEVAHHIDRELNGRHRVNGYGIHHGSTFYDILQQLHDLWR